MSIFTDYFRETLRFRPVLAGGPLAILAYGAALLLDAVREVMLVLRDQFFAERCEINRLSKFAKARGITRHPLETTEGFQSRVRLAYLWHKRGGRPEGMSHILNDYFGFGGVVVESLRSEDPTRWAEFRVMVLSLGTAESFDEEAVRWVINEIKPARSKIGVIAPNGAPRVFRVNRERVGDKLLYWPVPVD